MRPRKPRATILTFRHRLERHRLSQAIFADVAALLDDKGITRRPGTPVDASPRKRQAFG